MLKALQFQWFIWPPNYVRLIQVEEAIMSKETPKLPRKGGAQAAIAAVKKFRKQPPSERLIKIISEVPESEGVSKPDVAAKDAEI